MRAAILILAVSACTPEISPDTYLCGPQMLCPEDLSCNAESGYCEGVGGGMPACSDPNPASDNTPATGRALGALQCVSTVATVPGCLVGDTEDWFQLDVPQGCSSVEIDAHLSFPVAFEPLSLQIADASGAITELTATPCGNTSDTRQTTTLCVTRTVTSGEHVAIGVKLPGAEDCGGLCAFNTYTFTFQLDAAP